MILTEKLTNIDDGATSNEKIVRNTNKWLTNK